MQIQTEEMRMSMDGGKGVVPRRPGLMDVWIRILDAVVLVLTFGRGRVVRGPLHGRIRWDGNLKRGQFVYNKKINQAGLGSITLQR